MKKSDLSFEEVKKMIEECWESIPQKRSPVLWTGKGGVILYYETLGGRKLTQEEKDKIEDGIYKIKGGFVEKQ